MIASTPQRSTRRTTVSPRRRFLATLVLFSRLTWSFGWCYGLARLGFGEYNFQNDRARNRSRARLIRSHAIHMGGVMIKVGQFLSTRVDLLPDEYIEELSLLQDEVPAVAGDEIVGLVEAAFGAPVDETYSEFDPSPIASASLGQAHLARLWSGQQVVVKVKRPHIEQVVEADLSALRFVVNQMTRWRAVRRRVDLPGIFREFTTTLRQELDYIAEAHNAERLGLVFATDDDVLVPRVYWSRVRPGVITLEYLPGIKISEYERIEQAGISRSDLAEILLRSYLRQIIVDGFFHADPHPGNVFARPGPQLVLVDFGMVGRLTPRMRVNLRSLFVGVVRRDFGSIVQALIKLGFVRAGGDLAVVRRTVTWTVDTFYEMTFAELRDVDPKEVLDQTYEAFREDVFQIPTMFAFLGRAIGTLNGLCTGLDPNFQFASVARPFARRLMSEDSSWTGAFHTMQRQGRELMTTALALPRLTQDALEGISDGEWLRKEFANVSRGLLRVERMVRALLVGLLATAFLISASFLAPHYRILAIIALAITFLLVLRVAIFMFTSRHTQG